MPQLSPIETMTFAAACTDRLRLGCAVLVTTLHNPVHLAKSLSTLDQMSRGRLEIGVGTGGKGRIFAAFGVEPERFVGRFTEGLELMKQLWTRTRVTFDGRFWQLEDAAMEPKPFQKPHPSIWFGGSSPAALRRAVRHGNGFFGAGSSPTAQFAEQVRTAVAALAEQERDAAEFPIAKRVYVAVDESPERGRERINAALERLYGRRSSTIEAAAVAGTPEDCARALREVETAGAQLILLSSMFDHAEQTERLAAEVLPQLR